ncbi:hypothetical protein PWP93_36450 [Paraburkholderia sp. A1RI-2L]|uniref:hypothetical protein n=1 Tax=Paraburkholderia sp. A1RI-2L TaxID=3028367 RepID=UPI003B782765
MVQLVCTPAVGANIARMFGISAVFASVVMFSIVRWRAPIRVAIKKGVATTRRRFV